MKHRLVPSLIGSFAVSVVLASCVSFPEDVGATVSVDRDIGDVTAVSLRTSGTVILTTGAEPALTITASEKVIDNLTSEERGGVLILDQEGYTFGSGGQITYRLVLPAVEEISVNGSGSVDVECAPTGSLAVSVNGSGGITGREVEVEGLTVAIAGSGRVDLTGVTDSQVVTIEGSGTYRGADLRSANAAVEISGSGDVDVHATSTLDAVIAGSGSITYLGGATVARDITGSGRVEER